MSTALVRGVASLGVLSLLAATAPAQAGDADAAFRALRAEVPGLRADWNFDSGHPELIYGKAIRLFGVPTDDAGYEAAARQFVDRDPALFGFDSSTLATDYVKQLGLSRIGTTDKTVVRFTQWAGGMRVRDGSVNVLFDGDGAIVAVENRGLTGIGALDLTPAVDEVDAMRVALGEFGEPAANVAGIEIAVVADARRQAAALAWIVDLRGGTGADGRPHQERLEVDAHRGALLRRTSTVHSFTDVLGTSEASLDLGESPYTGTSGLTKVPTPFMRATSAVGDTDTDTSGAFVIAYTGTAQQTVTFRFGNKAKYTWVTNLAGANYSKSKVFTPGVSGKVNHNGSGTDTEFVTAQFDAAWHGVRFREWIRALDASDNVMEFRQHLNVNFDSSCNAYYDGVSTNYYRANGGCPNMAYSTIVYHETGHWANDRYGSGNGWDGFGEGAADTWATYIMDSPVVGKDFWGAGADLRTGLNTRQYCGTCGAGCWGEPHADGEVLMGALWKVRDYLNTSYGDAAGDLIADTIYHDWFVAYDAYRICRNNLVQWLTLDDDNGNLADGTPHSVDINQGFVDQGYPSYY